MAGRYIDQGKLLKRACTFFSLSMIKVHVVSVPVQSPSQPLKIELWSGVAVNTTVIFSSHDPNIVNIADRTLKLKDGVIISNGR